MPRIPYFDPDKAKGRAKHIFATEIGRKANIVRMLGHTGDLIDDFVAMSRQLRFKGTLDPLLRELAILRVGVLTNSRYEWHHHERMARQLGLSDEKIQGVRVGADSPAFSSFEQAVVRFTDDLVKNFRATDENFSAVANELPHRDLQELILNIGFYMMTSTFLETLDVEIETEDFG